MATLKIVGEAAVLTSSIKKATLELMKKYKPNALKLVEVNEDNKKETVFAISTGTQGTISKFGACFNAVNVNGKAEITLMLPANIEDKVAFVKDCYGYAILNLNKLETQIAAVETETISEFEAMGDSIEVL